jgi:hypothetical protein
MSELQQIYHDTLARERLHRQKLIKKLEKIQGLKALLEEWEPREHYSADNHLYVLALRHRLRSAEVQYTNMQP